MAGDVWVRPHLIKDFSPLLFLFLCVHGRVNVGEERIEGGKWSGSELFRK